MFDIENLIKVTKIIAIWSPRAIGIAG